MLMADILGLSINALLLTRLVFWLWRKFSGKLPKVWIPHVIVYFLGATLFAFGSADGGSPNFVYSFLIYWIPISVLLIIDLLRMSNGNGPLMFSADKAKDGDDQVVGTKP